MTRDPYQQVLDELGVLQALAEFEPTVIGTPPLGIDVSTSDIDVACTASDLSRFKSFLVFSPRGSGSGHILAGY